ncbi:hypothetical protein PF007_g6620 [Phytophthora fragariae]|uniref:Uncharacterized protein n=1 Tax=Phytophthora fragariae TaxID=53985 RepID=A0A6A3SW55_9STRA|nr:hypothetical protein PF007_g6620 [Phytophthora fragariae]KAE9243530.1 hypothetical protein PF004_g6100 [Phytophthora fragariae]
MLSEVVRAVSTVLFAASAAAEATGGRIRSRVVAELVERVASQVVCDTEPSIEDRLASAGLTLSNVEGEGDWVCSVLQDRRITRAHL